MSDTATTPRRKRKSVQLTKTEFANLKAFSRSKDYPTQDEKAEVLGVGRGTFLNILLKGSGSEDNISKVREGLSRWSA